MTITAMAKELNVSTMTIYRRCKKNGVHIDDLRDETSGELTAAGVAAIASLFDTTTPQRATTGDATPIQHDYNSATQTAPQGPEAASIAVLEAKLEGAAVLIEQLTSERDALREQLAAAQAALNAMIEDRQAERRLLTGSVDGDPGAPRRRRWWPWGRHGQ